MKRTKKLKKGLLVLLSVFLAVGAFSGCSQGEKKTSKMGTHIKWMVPGDHFSPADEAEVFKAYNDKLSQILPDVEVEIELVPFGDYAQRHQLTLSAKEDVDILWTGYLLSYITEATNGSYLALNDLLEEHAPDMLKEIPQWAWDKQSLNGNIYSVPNMQQVANEGKALFFQTEQGKKYMDREKLEKILNKEKIMTREGWDAIGNYLEKLKQNGELKKGVSTSSIPSMLGNMRSDQIVDNFVILYGEEDIKVWHLYETPEQQLMYDVMAEWYKKGYIVEDVASLESPNQYEFEEDGNILWAHNYFKDIEKGQQKSGRPWVDALGIKGMGPIIGMGDSATASAIVSYSPDSVAAIKVLDLMNTKKGADLFNTLAFGIEGKQYNLKEGRMSPVRDEQELPLYQINRWELGNVFNGYELESDPDNWYNYLLTEVQGPNVGLSPLLGFKPDVSGLSTELAHIRAVEGEYYRSLCDGALPDHKATYAEMMDKLKTAGLDKVKAELQSQIDKWLAENK